MGSFLQEAVIFFECPFSTELIESGERTAMGVSVDVYVWPQIVLAPGQEVTFVHWVVDGIGSSLIDSDHWYWMSSVPELTDVRPDRPIPVADHMAESRPAQFSDVPSSYGGSSCPMRRYYIVHNGRGKLLALAPVEVERQSDELQLGWRPVETEIQFVTEIELDGPQLERLSRDLEKSELRFDEKTGKPYVHRTGSESL
jgi:hypothetical protein